MSGRSLVYDEFDPNEEKLPEALCALGNHYVATRGAVKETWADDVHDPGMDLAEASHCLKGEISGPVIENEDLVNFPNWLCLTFRIEDGEWLDLQALNLLSYRQELDLKWGMLLRAFRFRDAAGKETKGASCAVDRDLVSVICDFLKQTEISPEEIHSELQISYDDRLEIVEDILESLTQRRIVRLCAVKLALICSPRDNDS